MDEIEKKSERVAAGGPGGAVRSEGGVESTDKDASRFGRDAAASKKAQQQLVAEQRKARSAAKLRENLMKRKQQLRARRSGSADETNGLPAAKLDESS